MSAILHAEWLNENSLRAYPFQEDMQRIPDDIYGNALPDAQLPNYVVLDFVFTLPASAAVRLYLSSLAVVGNLFTMAFSETGSGSVVCTVSVDTATHTTGTGYDLVGTGDWDDARGRIVLGDLSRLPDDVADGLYTFTSSQALLEACVVRPALRGVRSLQIQNGALLSDKIYGNVVLVAGANITLDYDQPSNTITISAVGNSSYSEDCDCGSLMTTNVLRTINGIAVSDLTFLSATECLEITTSGNKVIFKDKCSTPCCGCEELRYLTDSYKNMSVGLTQLQTFVNRLDSRVDTFVTNYILSLPGVVN